MKITLDLTSVVVGGAVALALGLVAGFSPQATPIPGITNIAPRQITGQFSPHPSDLVWLEARGSMSNPSSSFDSPTLTVPAGRIFVLTGICGSDVEFNSSVTIAIDGVERRFDLCRGYDFRNDAMTFSNGVPLVGGQTIQVRRSNSGYTWLHGYWADA